jgi:hypothetical protein
MLEMLKHDFLRHALAAAMIAGGFLVFRRRVCDFEAHLFSWEQRWLSWERLVSAWRF